jgi:hypothetical protein
MALKKAEDEGDDGDEGGEKGGIENVYLIRNKW